MKKLIATLLATALLLTAMVMTVSAKTYYVSDWAEEANDSFELTWSENPARNVEKGEFMFSFLRMIQASHARNGEELLESDEDLDFHDVDELDDDEQDEARILVELGVLNGYNGYMNMFNDVTRAEAAKILKFFNDELELDTVRSKTTFSDIEGHWAESYINYAYRIGLVNGKGTNSNGTKIYDPEGNLTVQEMMQIMYNIFMVNDDFTEEDIAFALVNTFDVDTDLDIDEYDDLYNKDSSILYLNVDDTVTYTSNGTTYWTSSKPSVAAVTSSGKITARSEGTAIITNGNDVIITVNVGIPKFYVTVGNEVSVSTYYSTSWKSSNTKVATVDKYGKVTGIKEGTATISRGTYEKYTVSVVEETVIEMNIDDTIKLGNTTSNWKSSNKDVVEVSSKGTVTAIGDGTAIISSKYASYLIFVSPTSNLNMNIGDTIKFESSSWTSSRPTIVSASSTGTIKALKKGTATISNKDVNITVTVGNYSSDYTRCYTLYVGETKTLGNGKYDSSWESDNTKIATVTNYGKVTAKKVGETTIYNDDEEYLITVVDDTTDYEDYDITIKVGQKLLVGDGSYDSSWESDNENIATVDNYGFVTGKKAGTTIVYNDDSAYYITIVASSYNDDNDNDYIYSDTIVYAEGFEPSSYYNAWTGDTIKIIVESENGDLEDVTLSNSKCKLTKKITYLGNNKYTFTVNSVSAGACILTLEFEDGETIEFTINSYKE